MIEKILFNIVKYDLIIVGICLLIMLTIYIYNKNKK